MHKLLTTTHMWVEHSVSPVEVVMDPFDNSVAVIPLLDEINPDQPQVMYGCSTCGVALSFEASAAGCSGITPT